MKKSRKLTAIMFTDIVGYTALMQADEERAVEVRARHREVFNQSHSDFNGDILQYYGDGTLSVFSSAVDAVACAIKIQKSLRDRSPKVDLRIGIHLGDVVHSDQEVYGDGVNLASRIENIATAGSILVSGRLNEELQNQKDISTQSIGVYQFKNIVNPVEVFAISNEGIVLPSFSTDEGRKDKSIAVLPFVNMSSDKENAYFSDGISEEIINALAKIDGLKVTSRTSSFFFKDKNLPIKEIGRQLGVASILEGSVRLSGTKLRITAQLIQVEDDFHFWSETWDRSMEDLFDIQDEISLLIAEKIREQFGHLVIKDHLVEKETESVTAYDCFLRARYLENKWNPVDMQAAIKLYRKALEVDPNYADAFLGLANSYGFLGTTGVLSYEEGWQKTAEYTQQALHLNGNLSGIHYQLSNLAFFIESDFEKSLSEMNKAVELNPNNATAREFLSFLLILKGDKEGAFDEVEQAVGINPLSDETRFFKAYLHYMIEEYEVALGILNGILEKNPKNIPATSIKSQVLLAQGKVVEFFSFLDKVPDNTMPDGEKLGLITLGHILGGHQEESTRHLESLHALAQKPEGFAGDSLLFFVYAIQGDNDKAFEWVEQALEKKSSLLLLRYTDPLAKNFRNDKRYNILHEKIYGTAETEKVKTINSAGVDRDLADQIEQKLSHLIREEKIYLDPDLSLRKLAERLQVHSNQLSWVLNQKMGSNYNEFINSLRLEAFKEIAANKENSHLTIEGLAYESGFNSKTVFNTFFKKHMGLTPRGYLKSLQ
ncbi:helix-turn-helix domain-containing protein [Cryomorphaceae bacterium 1068]|nr:helix-turn-helix domain-containing protein [Cryomorphaceae bacterium 1068]